MSYSTRGNVRGNVRSGILSSIANQPTGPVYPTPDYRWAGDDFTAGVDQPSSIDPSNLLYTVGGITKISDWLSTGHAARRVTAATGIYSYLHASTTSWMNWFDSGNSSFNASVFMVFSLNTHSTNISQEFIYATGSTGTPSTWLFRRDKSTPFVQCGRERTGTVYRRNFNPSIGPVSGLNYQFVSGGAMLNRPCIFQWVNDGGQSIIPDVKINNYASWNVGSWTENLGISPAGSLLFGWRCPMDLADLWVYDRVLTQEERDQVTSYLASLYSVTLEVPI